MINTSQFADAVGRREMATAVGVGMTAISNAVVRGRFPPAWFGACQDLAAGAGIDCPEPLFGMKRATHSESEHITNSCQSAQKLGAAE